MNRFANRKVQDQPLDSKATMASDIPTHASIRSVHAGLWGDPFQGIAKPTKAVTKPTDADEKTDSKNLRKSDDYRLLLEQFDPLSIVAVIVPGEDTETEIEDRTNYRHAVEQALANEGYSMEFPGRMSFVEVNWELEKNRTRLSHRSEVPLKLYRKEPDSGQKADPDSILLVCWIDRRFLGDKPLAALDHVLLQIDCRSNRKTTVVGPMFSSELTSMAEEAKALEDPSVKLTNWAEWSIVSPAATNKEAQQLAVSNLSSCGFRSTIGTDDGIAEKLVQEIGARRLHLGNIVIFSEAGATSPRGLKTSLELMLIGNPLQDDSNKENAVKLKSPLASNPTSSNRIRSFEYLRGIGSVQKDGSTRVDDYFLRKLDSVVTDENDLSPSSVSAVIVLGDEAYDKVKLIEIAKASFPNATCLTHDLSYLYSTPENIAFCRGLLVASHGGLSVKEDLTQAESSDQSKEKAKETFEFRDVYQRSYYRAMTYAIAKDKSENPEDSITTIFEIGLQHPIKIEPGSTKVRWWNLVMFTYTGISTLLLLLFSFDYLRADRLRSFKEKLFAQMRADEKGLTAFSLTEVNTSLMVVGTVVYQQLNMYTSTFAYVVQVLVACILLCIILTAIVRFLRSKGSTGFGMTGYMLVVLLSTLVCLFVIMEILDKHGLQLEPLDALSGISVWPSVAAFVVVIALCLDWLRRFGARPTRVENEGRRLRFALPIAFPKTGNRATTQIAALLFKCSKYPRAEPYNY